MNLHDPQLAKAARHLAEPVRTAGPAHVSILLGMCEGAEFLGEQLASIAAQTHTDWSLIVGDDGSRDGSDTIVHRFANTHAARSIRLVPGPRRGFQHNFLHLLSKVPDSARYVAFADQDDVWLQGKLARAITHLERIPTEVPALYGARTCLTDAALAQTGYSPRFERPPGFRNALVQSLAGGNTMVINRAAFDLLRAAARRSDRVVSHDWWAYQLISGAGGKVVYDHEPSVLYRQHGANVVGAGAGIRAKLNRLARLIGGDFQRYTDTNIAALSAARDMLTPVNRAVLDDFCALRKAALRRRIMGLARVGIYRQTRAGSAALWAAAVLGRL